MASTLGLLILAACGNHAAPGAAGCPAAPGSSGNAQVNAIAAGRDCRHSIMWLVPLSLLQYRDAGRTLFHRAFINDRTYVYGGPPGMTGIPTAAYSSYAEIRAAFKAGVLPGRYRAVIYDNERWPYTPVAEQKNPAYYERLVAILLHRHGLVYIATPAPDLMWATGRPKDSYVAYLQHDVAGKAARYADVVDIQGQVRETELRRFVAFVAAAVRQCRKSNPHIKVLIGLRTDPGEQRLFAAYQAVAGLADGYWLNVNGQPQVAVSFLRQIYGAAG